MKKTKLSVLVSIVMILCFVLSGFSLAYTNDKLLKNAQVMGVEITSRFAINEESYIDKYKIFLNIASEHFDTLIASGASKSRIRSTLDQYTGYIENQLGVKNVEAYIILNDKIIAQTYMESDKNYDPCQQEWYQKTIKNPDNISFSDVYTDARLKKKVVTLSKCIGDSKNVVALDIYPGEMTSFLPTQDIPDDSRYFILDSKGELLSYYIGDANVSQSKVTDFMAELFKEIQTGQHDQYDSYIESLTNEKRGVYYSIMDNGWYVVLTIPYENLLGGGQEIILIYGIVVFSFMLVLILLLIQSKKSNQRHQLYNRITKALGDSYYALYLIDLKKETYAMLKASDQVRYHLPTQGYYQDWLDYLENLIVSEYYEEFRQVFSIEHMKSLVQQSVHRFGGDFQRIFNGTNQWVNVQMLYNESKKEVYEVVLAFQNINERKEEELSQLKLMKDSMEATKSAVQSKNKFFSNMSHDMRTPLNAIINFTSMAQNKDIDPIKQQDYLNKIAIASKQLLDLINDILEVSKSEQGYVSYEFNDFSLKDQLSETLMIYEEQAKLQKKTFTIHYDLIHDYVRSDWKKLRQILVNLISNALKYTKENDTISFKVKEIAQGKRNKYEFIIQDTGIGMSQEFIEKLYTPYMRETHFHSRDMTGTGLGMAIVYYDVQHLDGQIHVESELEKGTTFHIIIPMEPAKKSVKAVEVKKDIDLHGKKVLLAEDNELNMEISTELLQMEGIEVVQAWDGKEAYEIFKQSKDNEFDVILMDMHMPIMDGLESTRLIRKLKRQDALTIPILAVTANTFTEDIVKTKEAGMDGHLAKPIDIKILMELIEQVITK